MIISESPREFIKALIAESHPPEFPIQWNRPWESAFITNSPLSDADAGWGGVRGEGRNSTLKSTTLNILLNFGEQLHTNTNGPTPRNVRDPKTLSSWPKNPKRPLNSLIRELQIMSYTFKKNVTKNILPQIP